MTDRKSYIDMMRTDFEKSSLLICRYLEVNVVCDVVFFLAWIAGSCSEVNMRSSLHEQVFTFNINYDDLDKNM